MILVHTVEKHHRDSLMKLIDEFKENHDTRMPEWYVSGTYEQYTGGSEGLLENIHSDYHIHKDTPRPYLTYFYDNIVHEHMNSTGTLLGLESEWCNFSWEIDRTWFQQYYEKADHFWHTHARSNYANVYFLELPDENYKTEILDSNGKLIDYDAKEGDIITFPAGMQHRSAPNSAERKTVISFNSNYSIQRKL